MNVVPITPPPPPPGGLAALADVKLNEHYQRMLDDASAYAGGSPIWCRRKKAEARDLLALAQISGRLRVAMLDLAEPLRALMWLAAPVPCRPDERGELRIADGALLGLTYGEEAIRQALPGYAFLQVLAPADPWHANIVKSPIRALCLGPQLPAGVRVKELILMAYGALTMQTVQYDEFGAIGVFNLEAARWWQQNQHRIPLTREPFLCIAKPQAERKDQPCP
jgi:hypothetical protein